MSDGGQTLAWSATSTVQSEKWQFSLLLIASSVLRRVASNPTEIRRNSCGSLEPFQWLAGDPSINITAPYT